jgi:ribonuclease D
MAHPGRESPLAPPIVVENEAGLGELLGLLRGTDVISVDTESNSMHAYAERICLVQISVGDQDFVVDPLKVDIAALGELLNDPSREKIFHAAEYDVMCLRRDYGFSFAGLFDTMISARILGWQRYGLGSILSEIHGIVLNKKMQQHDWGRRPLSNEALEYAQLDTRYLADLRERQLEELESGGHLEEARAAFARVAQVQATPRTWDPQGFWGIKGAKKLEPQSAAVLAALWRFREELAKKIDRPLFRVARDNELITIAQAKPQSHRGLRAVRGVSHHLVRRNGRQIVEEVRLALEGPNPTPPERSPRQKKTPAAERLTKLMAWRKAVAEKRGVENDVVLPKRVLQALADQHPEDVDALRNAEILDDWQLGRYADEVLKVLER